ncbi:hypothetical protein FRC09_001330 [Ceratobasidium sp. 395]|nr:hypothetical protein FRC09_001330 [Ceratobasidium sp. 395]
MSLILDDSTEENASQVANIDMVTWHPRPSFTFNPPPGGNISIQSSDGQVFSVHTLILGLASSMFSDMFTVGTRVEEIIDLAEDSETISIMLAYIYPSGVPPPLDSFDILEKSLVVAQKYDLKAMLEKIDRSLSTESACKTLVENDPLRVFSLTVTYELHESQIAAIRAVRPTHADLSRSGTLTELAHEYPGSAHIVKLIGIQAARAEVLSEFFYDLGYRQDPPLAVYNQTPDDKTSWLICEDCRVKTVTITTTLPVRYFPVWLNGWASNMYKRFREEPRKDHSHCFTVEMFDTLVRRPRNAPFCQNCVKTALKAKKGRVLRTWLEQVEEDLVDRLQALDQDILLP